jgi:hypothetical protein
MKRHRLLILTLIPLILLLVAGFCLQKAQKKAIPTAPPTGFALVELFTSEGCSSCPPADGILAKVAMDYKSQVYVMGFHVDYWDKLGWKDAFSNSDFTHRQQEYARVLSLRSIYTPQAVVNGENELVGSDESKLRATIEADLKKPSGKSIELQARRDGQHVKANYKVPAADKEVLNIALVQLHAESEVKAGENDGRSLKHINVVRDLKSEDVLAGSSGSVSFTIPRGLAAKDCKLIAWLQGTATYNITITGAAETDIP